MTNDLCFTPATELAPLIRSKALSPVELIDSVLVRIEAREPRINAFATLTAEQAREAARRSEAALMQGDATGALFGLPVTIKDLTETAGIPTERGSHAWKGYVPTVDAPVVSRLAESGAISLGKTTISEFAWTGVSWSPLTGITSNPWKDGYNAGASSAGAAAAAAAGYGPLHQGSDGAGSIRMPSALLRHLRHQADLWPGAKLAGAEQRPDLPCGANDPDGGRRRPDAEGDGGPPPVGSHQPGGRAC